MADGTKRRPSPAQFIREQLDTRGMTQLDLAFVLGTTQQAVNQLALGKRGVSADMALALGEVFEVEPAEIMQMQKEAEIQAELGRARPPDPAITRKARLTQTYPIREMIKRGWLVDDPKTLEDQVARFFGVTALEEVPHLPHAAKKTSYFDSVPPAQLAWLFRVKEIAARVVAPTFTEKALRDALPKLRDLLCEPDAASRAPRILIESGVRFVVVENLPGGKIDGVCFWLRPDAPVIGMTMRFDRIDNFWHVLRHEIEHVLRRDGVASINIDESDDNEDEGAGAAELPEAEHEANAAAADFAVPKAKMESWIARKQPFFSENDLLGFAKVQGVHPGIVAGQLRHRIRNFRVFKHLLVKIRAAVTATAVVDGWGETYPINERST